ncbi:alpha-ketoacid dehydrogenase subunit alpha/beta [Peloplasma aerotolerans]|uniref:Thiamine pyrophosphate-dependent enzyme n=1 Tax=Peloplasma aerotolerans TaxID=3044389 RepID=A0AAW6U4L6_9MOLU|nr:alpha-ketoacid dehydrogenase subunit alpha/beta [Mariniplasma sp. M4Ah]MDI6452805.1 thiamine pyrophosphate-dependent enzyme [Mariniplasma sp. M4Ah]
MPKSKFIDPKNVLKPSKITFKDIPVNDYKKTILDEKDNYSKDDFLRMFHDMATLREFESMLYAIKVKGEYEGFKFSYPGPAHLSMGQEAASVGQAYLLEEDDLTFGSHRSHSEVLARGLVSIHKLSEDKLINIMKQFEDGATYNVVHSESPDAKVKDLAVDFLLYGTLAEIFAKKTGFHKGMGGSMHVFFQPFGIYPNNAIVGGSAPIATGAALFKKVNDKNGLVIANIGDGSLGCGVVYESLNFAAMDQFTELWEKKGGLPIIFNVFNNGYGMGGQTRGETMAYDFVARLGAGISPSQLHAERVDGFNLLAVIDAYKRKLEVIKNGLGPVFLDVVTYRFSGHSPSDAMSYRSKEEIDAWEAIDPLITFRENLVKAKIANDDEFEAILNNVKERMYRLFLVASDVGKSPYLDLGQDPLYIESLMFSNQAVESFDTSRKSDVLLPYEENPRVKLLKSRERYAFDDNGKMIPKIKQYNIRDGLFEAIIDRYYKDPTLISYGEDVRDWGGAFAVYRGLTEALPYHRLFNSPISEATIVSTAVGYGLSGGRVIVELMYADFMGRAGDEIFNQLAKWQAMSSGVLKMPVVLRVSIGSKYGAQHSQDWIALPAHVPGLKVVFPATPYDAKGLMNAALNGTDPVVFFESQRIYDKGEEFVKTGVPEEYYEIPLGEPNIKKAGSDVTILTIGATLYHAIEAAKILKEKYNVSAEVIDARSIVPFNYELVIESIKKTGKIVLASDACSRGSILNDFARNISEMAFDYLDGPPVVVGAKNWITPPYEFDSDYFPQADWIIDAIHDKILPLNGHVSKQNNSVSEQLRKAKKGV